jgi:hypothetical protein
MNVQTSKNYKKVPKESRNCRGLLGLWGTGGASPPPATVTAARVFTRRRRQCPETGGSDLFSPSLPFLTGGRTQHHLQKKKHTQQLILFGFYFRSVQLLRLLPSRRCFFC